MLRRSIKHKSHEHYTVAISDLRYRAAHMKGPALRFACFRFLKSSIGKFGQTYIRLSVCTNNHRDEFSFKTVTVVLVFMQFAVFCYHRVKKHIKTVTVVKCSKGKNTPRAPNLSYHKHHQTHLIIYMRKAGQIAGFCLYR